ncbi:unnamed protein product [Callosobruchus maculatus]|uniref:acid phosphatase n=1 Tax=Callosobruchus maculatus TaxID=64391 RepID=A0A653BV34_CALMS|nr:unnamed protein product [Callosobruchus maculatus]
MVGVIYRVLLFCLFSLIANEAANIGDELVAVAVVFRHGDRSPLDSFPNDPYFNGTYWPMGVGQLLNFGKNNSYQLGRYLRQRYKTFLSDQYKRQEIEVLSSDVDRTIMSAQLMLAAMYPPTPEDVWLEGFPWQPIPVHSITKKIDNLIGFDFECPKRSLLFNAAETEVLDSLRALYPDIFKAISQNSGWDQIGESQLRCLVGTMNIYKKFKPAYVPEWYAALDQQTMDYIAGACFQLPTHTEQLRRLTTGPLFNHLINKLDGAIKGETHKFLMLSGHDSTLAPLLDTVDCFDYKIPDLASVAIFEVYRTANGQHYINLLYKNGAESEAGPILVDKCKNSWNYDEFKTFLAPIRINDEDWTRECEADSTTGASGRIEARFALISVIFFWLNICY